MKLNKIKKILNCQIISEKLDTNIDIKHVKASDLMSDVLASSEPGSLLLTGLTHNNVIRTCEIAGISAVVFVRNKKPTTETIKLAEHYKISILSTELTMFEACGILYSKGVKDLHLKK